MRPLTHGLGAWRDASCLSWGQPAQAKRVGGQPIVKGRISHVSPLITPPPTLPAVHLGGAGEATPPLLMPESTGRPF